MTPNGCERYLSVDRGDFVLMVKSPLFWQMLSCSRLYEEAAEIAAFLAVLAIGLPGDNGRGKRFILYCRAALHMISP